MGKKLLKADRLNSAGGQIYAFFCPGCKAGHNIVVGGGRGWTCDGNVDAPTIHPSIKLFTPADDGEPEITHCHSFVKAGMIEFLSDCEHALAGQTVPLPDWPEDYGHNGLS